MQTEQRLKQVFSETFNIPENKITTDTKQGDFEEWNSLGQLRLIMEIESVFNISFLMEEVPVLDTFDKLLLNIQKKLGEE